MGRDRGFWWGFRRGYIQGVLFAVVTGVLLFLLFGCASTKVYPVDVHLSGACCLETRCVVVDKAYCLEIKKGTFKGYGTVCGPGVCG